jgi:hypothetical protein
MAVAASKQTTSVRQIWADGDEDHGSCVAAHHVVDTSLRVAPGQLLPGVDVILALDRPDGLNWSAIPAPGIDRVGTADRSAA